MTDHIDEKRIGELTRRLKTLAESTYISGIVINKVESADLLFILSDYSKVKAERDEWKETAHMGKGLKDALKAELTAAQMTNAKNGAIIIEQMAELAKQAPRAYDWWMYFQGVYR